MHGAPDHKGPGGAVPEPAQQKSNEKIAQGAGSAAAVAAERDIKIIPQPAGKRNVPAPPEILNIAGLVRRVEVPGQMNIEKKRAAYSHVAIAGKVEIELKSIGDAAEAGFKKGHGACNVKAMSGYGGKVVSDQKLFCQADAENHQSVKNVFPLYLMAATVKKLRHHFPMVDNGAGYQLWKKADEAAVIDKAFMAWIMLLCIDI